ncbi:MAG: sigma-70 family RNA polymerase sigma factor [Clostridia bacterium]|nr:sigma-70 family RNA polymerase sigma factor [Clostridia bacterium]MBO4429462.1 sigma-70 family RNA polymerase sigma factor [Clostridia bacterium]
MNEKKEVSFNNLYKSYLPLIESIAKKMILTYSLSPSEYDDLVQEGAIALYTSADAYDESRNVTFGLYAKICIKNRLISYINSHHHPIPDPGISIDDIEDQASDGDTPEQILIDKESVDNIKSEADSVLSPFEKSVFWLYISGISYKDIAKALDRSTKSIDNSIKRIKDKLRKIFSL